jgi:ABC-2 type transport system permease protein
VNSHRPVSTTRAIWIIGRLALRRQINRWQSVRFARKTRGGQAQRSGTATKSGRRSIFGLCLFVLMVFSGFIVTSSGIIRISAVAQNLPNSPGKFVVGAYTYARLIEADKALQDLKRLDDPAQRRKYQGMWNRHLDELFIFEVRRGAFTEDEENLRLGEMRRRFSAKGASGFSGAKPALFVSAATAPSGPEARTVFLRALSLLFALWIPMNVFLALGVNNNDLSQVEWSFEWLYTFPVSARALFVSKVFAYSFLDQLVWWLLFPFAVLVYVAGGSGYAAVPLGFAATLCLAIPAGCISTVVEVALRKFLSLDRLKNAQALFTVLGTACLLIFYACMFSPALATVLVHRAAAMPVLTAWNPAFLPLMVSNPALRGWPRQLLVLELIGGTFAAVFCAALGSEWLTRDGLIKAGGPYQGARSPGQGRIHDTWLRGIGAQEMLLLRRDRNLLVQVLIVPLLVPAYYLLIDPHLRSALTGNFRRAAMVAFVVGAYSFVNSAMPLLSREDKTLWLLLSFPRGLVSMLLDKAMFWAVVGLLYGGTVLLLLVHFSPHLHVTSWGYVFLVFYGIALYAFIAAGIGVLGTNVLETERRAQMRVGVVYLYFVLTAMYASIFYSASLWTSLGQLVLTTLLALALWQKVKDVAPYLLDPTQWPPRRIGLADGMIAALGFFVAQALVLMLLEYTSAISLTAQTTIAYLIAGLIVGAAVLGTFWLQRVPDLWKQLGFIPAGDDRRRWPAARGIMQGAIWGGAAAAGAFIYLHALGLFSQWQVWKQDAEMSSFLTRADQPLWICVLLIVAAPMLEEFLFRGLVFQGLRRTTGPLLAVLGSAALFALVHPPIAVIPVFGLGIAAAISFNRSKFLLAPILTHAVYNGCVLFFNRF